MTLWGRTLGVLSTASAIVLWLIYAFFNPHGPAGVSQETMLLAFVMVALASSGLAASLQDRPWLLLLAALAALIPIGLVTLVTPGIFRWIGMVNLMTLAGAILLLADRRRSRIA